MMTTKPKTFHLPAIDNARIAVFQSVRGGCYYVLAPNIQYSSEFTDAPELSWLSKHQFTRVYLPADVCLADNERFFVFANADCFDPPRNIVSGSSESDAHDEFLANTHLTTVEEPDLADYDEDSLTYDDNGRPHDTSQLMMEEVRLVLVVV